MRESIPLEPAGVAQFVDCLCGIWSTVGAHEHKDPANGYR